MSVEPVAPFEGMSALGGDIDFTVDVPRGMIDELDELEREALANDPPGTSSRAANLSPVELVTRLHWAADERAERAALARANLPRVRSRLGARYIAELPAGPPDPLLIDRLDPHGHTILYGSGGAGKGTLATWWIVQLVRAGRRVLILDYEAHADEWARRFRGLAGDDGGSSVLWTAPLAAAWQGRRAALWAQTDDIHELVEGFGADYLVIDSIVPACGGADPLEPGTVAKYSGALEYLGRPALSLAHVPKSGDLAYPYGSAFWHNLARITWSLTRESDRIVLAHRKANNYSRLGRFDVEVTYWNEMPRDVVERGYTAVLADRIDEVLGEAAMSVAEIVAALAGDDEDGAPPPADSVRAALRRGAKAVARRYAVEGTGSGAKWRRADA